MCNKFSPEEEERLVDLVREHPPLYKVKSRSYRDSIVKNNIWKKIAQELGKSGEFIVDITYFINCKF